MKTAIQEKTTTLNAMFNTYVPASLVRFSDALLGSLVTLLSFVAVMVTVIN